MTEIIELAETTGVARGFNRPTERSDPVTEYDGSPFSHSESLQWDAALKRARSEGASQRIAFEILLKLANGVTLELKDTQWINGHKTKFTEAVKASRLATGRVSPGGF
jgi:hypothetical protein